MPQLYTALGLVLAECAATATCQEFIERDGEVFAVVTSEDVIAYCEAKDVGPFPGKRQILVAFVHSEEGRVASWEGVGTGRYRKQDEQGYKAAVDRFMRGGSSLRTLGG